MGSVEEECISIHQCIRKHDITVSTSKYFLITWAKITMHDKLDGLSIVDKYVQIS